MKSQEKVEIRTYIKGHVTLKTSGSQTYNELCQIHRTFAISKTLVFRWYKEFEDVFTNHNDGSRSGKPKTIITSANSANDTLDLHCKTGVSS